MSSVQADEICNDILESQVPGLHETPAPPINVGQKEWLYAVNMITLINIERGSGGVPTSFVQDCLSSTRAIYENKFNRKWLIFRARVIQKTFSEAYSSEDFILIKVEFKLF